MDWLNKSSVLVLNSLYQIIGTLTPKKALIALNSSSEQNNIVAKSINVVYQNNEDGTPNTAQLDYWIPVDFIEWLTLKPRPGIDKIIHSPKLEIRCPTIICTNYSKMPMRKFRLSKGILYDMQDGRCGYSGRKLPIKKGNIEHKRARSHGGKDTFENCLFVDSDINSKRGNKPLSEMGLTPLFHHKEPKPIPVHHTIKQAIHPDWFWFISQ